MKEDFKIQSKDSLRKLRVSGCRETRLKTSRCYSVTSAGTPSRFKARASCTEQGGRQGNIGAIRRLLLIAASATGSRNRRFQVFKARTPCRITVVRRGKRLKFRTSPLTCSVCRKRKKTPPCSKARTSHEFTIQATPHDSICTKKVTTPLAVSVMTRFSCCNWIHYLLEGREKMRPRQRLGEPDVESSSESSLLGKRMDVI